MSDFCSFDLQGVDAEKFLQGQITADVRDVGDAYTPCAVCNLKGRAQFGLWIKRKNEGFGLVLASDLAQDFQAHLKKYGAFSKIALSDPAPIYPAIVDNAPDFSSDPNDANRQAWQEKSLATGNYWITKRTSERFQPQELRLHQRGGVSYKKGCYLGQEVVARLYFKSRPKAYLHRVFCADPAFFEAPPSGVAPVNCVQSDAGVEALVVARPDVLKDATNVRVLPLPEALQGDAART